jgi:AcrR family transcriptional regulator
MPPAKADSRERLVRAAEEVTYRHGFGNAALADIAKAAKVPPGNVYYYFKTKDAIGDAVIGQRLARFHSLLRELDKADSPAERLCAFVQIKIDNRAELARSGCPVGTLCSELHKRPGRVAKRSTELFAEGLAWMETQFTALGARAEARARAVHLMSALQGVSLLAHTFHDPDLITNECERLKKWIRALATRKGEAAVS